MSRKNINDLGAEVDIEDCEDSLIELRMRLAEGRISIDVYNTWVAELESKIMELEYGEE